MGNSSIYLYFQVSKVLPISLGCCDPTETALSHSMLLSASSPINVYTGVSVYSNSLWALSHPHMWFRSVSSWVTLACLSWAWSLCSACSRSYVSRWVPANSSRASHMGILYSPYPLAENQLQICRLLVILYLFSSPSSNLARSSCLTRPKLQTKLQTKSYLCSGL